MNPHSVCLCNGSLKPNVVGFHFLLGSEVHASRTWIELQKKTLDDDGIELFADRLLLFRCTPKKRKAQESQARSQSFLVMEPTKTLFLLRGLPGSGKSFLAAQLKVQISNGRLTMALSFQLTISSQILRLGRTRLCLSSNWLLTVGFHERMAGISSEPK